MNPPSSDPDLAAIRQTALDYYGSWYEADAGRMARSLHAGLAKRAIERDAQGQEYLYHLTKEEMVAATGRGAPPRARGPGRTS